MALETWKEIDRPVGKRPTPSWCKDVHIEWCDQYSNPPTFNLKTDGTAFDWPGKCFSYSNGIYTAKSDDGRIERHAHNGPVSMGKVKMFQPADGSPPRQHRRSGPEWGYQPGLRWTDANGVTSGYEPGEWVDVDHLVTTQQQGYAGRGFRILRDDGQYVMLRGPWHISAAPGYIAVTVTDCSKPDHWVRRAGLKWWRRTGCFGLAVKSEVLIEIVSRYQPHIRLASVTRRYGGPYLEPLKPEWNAPKVFSLSQTCNHIESQPHAMEPAQS